MANEIGAGDLVECINDQFVAALPENPRVGEIRRVAQAYSARWLDGRIYGFLRFDGFGALGWDADCFRKIEPPHDELTRAIRACRPMPAPVKVPEHVEAYHGQ